MAGATQLAEHRPLLVDVDALADQGGPVAAAAALEDGRALVQPATQEGEFELWNFANRDTHFG
jgi:hypothetical protein